MAIEDGHLAVLCGVQPNARLEKAKKFFEQKKFSKLRAEVRGKLAVLCRIFGFGMKNSRRRNDLNQKHC